MKRCRNVLTNPVHVLVHVIRHVIVDDMGHVGDIQPPGGHSSCHQDWLVASAEVEQSFFPLSLKPEDKAKDKLLPLKRFKKSP